MKRIHVLALLSAAVCCSLTSASLRDPEPPACAAAVRSVLTAATELQEVPLRDVIAAATGHSVLPLQPAAIPADEACRQHLSRAADELLRFLNAPDSPAKGLRRINEVSRHAEDQMLKLLNAGDFSCELPKTKSGEQQRAGYPDLKLTHKPSGRTYFLDPKLYEAGAESSTLRTFYYEPRELTGKIHSDACHLLLGIAHNGDDGAWRFTAWKLVDLHHFRVRLKAEFQGSNRDLYQPELTVAESVAP